MARGSSSRTWGTTSTRATAWWCPRSRTKRRSWSRFAPSWGRESRRPAMPTRPAYLLDVQREIEAHARGYGLDFWDTSFEVLDYKRMQEVAAFGGFPVRYPHWRFGMDFDHLTKSHIYGLSKIYEMVI